MTQMSYIPALRFHALTRFYDALLARTLKEEALNRRLIAQTALEPGMRVLDLGCGTATRSSARSHSPSAALSFPGSFSVAE